MASLIVAARERRGLLGVGGIREHEAFLGHELRGPAGTGHGGVSMAGGQEGEGARKGNGVRGHRLHPFCILIYMNSYIFHISFILLMMMIAFITIKSSLVPLIEGLCAQIYFRFEISVVCSHLLLFFL